jgi:hypothetical protein
MESKHASDLNRLVDARRQLDARLVELLTTESQISIDELRSLRDRRQIIDESIRQCSPPDPPNSRPIVWNALVVATLVVAAATIPMRSVRFEATMNASSAVLTSSAEQSLTGFPEATEFRLGDGCGSIETSWSELQSFLGNQADAVRLKADSLSVRRVSFDTGTRVTVTPQSSALYFAIEKSKSPISIEIETSGRTEASLSDSVNGWSGDAAATEWITLETPKSNSSDHSMFCSFTLVAVPNAQTNFSGLQISAVDFVEPGTSSESPLSAVSSLNSGSITIENVEKPTALHPGDGLKIDGLQSERTELVINDTASLLLSGVATQFLIRQGPTSRSLVPTVLEYLSRDKAIATLWAALGLLWSLTLWIRTRAA